MHSRLLIRARAVHIWLMAPLLGLLGVLTVAFSAGAPVAQAITASTNLNFQARLYNSTGGLVPDGLYNIDFKIYNADSTTGTVGTCTGACLWEETRKVFNTQGVSVVNGYFSVNLGSVTSFPAINWDQQLWLTMNIGGTSAGASPTWDGEMQNSGHSIALTSVPLAFRANQLAVAGTNEQVLQFANSTFGQATTINLQDPVGTTANLCYETSGGATAHTCAAATGGSGYIQNSTGGPQAANFNIISNASGSIGGIIHANASQSVDIFDVQNSSSTTYFGINSTGSANFQATNSATAFRVQNSSGSSLLNIDSTAANTNNLVANPSFETAVSNWSAMNGGSAGVQSSAQAYEGTNSLLIATNTTAGGGGSSYSTGAGFLSSSTAYTLSFYAKTDSNILVSTFEAGRSDDGTLGNKANCLSGKTLPQNGGWQRFSCSFTTGTTSGSPYIYFKVTDNVNRNLYIDDVLLQTTANSQATYQNATLNLAGTTVNSALTLQGSSNSSTALQILNASGASILNVDTTDNNLIANPDFEVNTTGWSANGSATILRESTAYNGIASLKINIGSAATGGAQYSLNPVVTKVSTNYTVSFYTLLISGTAPTLQVTYDPTGSNPTTCSPSGVVVTLGWKRVQCTVSSATTPTTGGFIRIAQTNSNTSVWEIDSVQMEEGASATTYGLGNISINGLITSPVVIRNNTDSETVFQVQNASSAPIFQVDTNQSHVRVGDAGSGTVADLTVTNTSGSNAIIVSTPSNLATDSSYISFVSSRAKFGYNGTDGSVDIVAGSTKAFEIHTDAQTNAAFLIGTVGNVLLQNTTDSTIALNVKNLAGNSLFNVDTSGNLVGTARTNAVSSNTTDLNLRSGNALGATSNSGSVKLDVGSATGTTGTLLIGTVNDPQVLTIGSTTMAGTITVGQADATNSINIGSANATAHTQTITIGGGTSTTSGGKVVNIATGVPGASTTNTVHIGDGGTTTGTVAVTVGSIGAAGHVTTIQGGNGAGAVSIQAASSGTILVGNTNSNAITLGGATSTITLAGNTSASKDIDITGSLATKKGSDYTSTGTQADINFGDASLIRLNPASALTIAGIANGRDGYQLRLVNVTAATNVTINNNDTVNETTASRLIITGTGSSVTILPGAAVEMIYDSGTSVWRIVGSGSSAAGGTFLAKNSTDTSSASVGAAGYLYTFTNSNSAVSGGVLSLDNGSNTGTVLNVKGTGTAAFQVQNANSLAIFNVDTTTNNLVTNPSFEPGTTGWTTVGTGTGHAIAQNNTVANIYNGNSSLQVTTDSNQANTGASVTSFTASVPAASYVLSFLAMGGATNGNFSTLSVTMTGSGTTCTLNSTTVSTAGFQRYTCSFTSSGTTTAINFLSTDAATQHIFYLDAVQLVTSANNKSVYNTGSVQLLGNINSPATFQAGSNSTVAFQVQNASGGSLINVDSLYSNITLLGNNDGQLGPWTSSANQIPNVRDVHSSVTANGYVYVLGGYDGSTLQSTVYYAKLNADGSAGTWNTNVNALPQLRDEHASVVVNGYVYVIGGYNSGGSAQSTVYSAKLNADGSTGAWTTNNALPANRAGAAAVTANGYIYVVGGSTAGSGSEVSTIYYAKVNSDGSIGSWLTDPNALPLARFRLNSVVANGFIYAIGGNPSSTIYYASLNADGSTGAWSTNSGNPLPGNRWQASAVVLNGYVYEMGGSDGSTTQSTVYYGKLNNDGSIGAWSTNTANPLLAIRSFASAVTSNGYVYVLGGSSGTVQKTVYYSSGARLKVGGNLDLVGAQGQTLADGGDYSSGSAGGSITAGNITAVGSLQVQGQANFSQNLQVGGALSVNGGATVRGISTSANLFQVQNAGSVNVINASTVNLVANSSFEGGTTNVDNTVDGWAKKLGSETSIKLQTTAPQFGSQSLELITTTTTAQGVKSTITGLLPSTQYTLSFYAKVSSGGFATLTFGRSDTGVVGGDTSCVTTGSINTNFARYNCTFTTGATMGASGTPYIYITKGTDASVRTIYIDGVQLEAGATTTDYRNGDISVDALATFRSTAGSTTAFQIQNAAGTQLFNVDSLSAAPAISLSANTTVSADLTVVGMFAIKHGLDESSTGSLDLEVGGESLIRLTGASTQTLIGMTTSVDGHTMTIINAAAQNAIVVNQDAGASATDRILTGTGNNLIIAPDAAMSFVYDSQVSRWRVVNGGANSSLSNLSSVAINTSLLPNADNTIDLGSSGNSWRTMYADTSVQTPSVTSSTTLLVDSASGSTLSIGTGANAHNITIGNATGSTAVSLQSGTGNITLKNNTLANAVATGTTATTSGTGTNTTTVTLTGSAFANGDVIFIDNAGQDYYTRITAGGGTASLTVDPAVTFETARTVTKYTVQYLGSDGTNFSGSTRNQNSFFQGYFAGGVVTGAGSTTYSDSNIASSGTLRLNTNGVNIQGANSANAFQVLSSGALNVLSADTSGNKVNIGSSTTDSTAVILVLDSYNSATEPSETDGAMYFNTALNSFRCGYDSLWYSCAVNNIEHSYNFEDEFLTGQASAASANNIYNVGALGWTEYTQTSCAVTYNNNASILSHDTPGYMQILATATSGDGCVLTSGSSNGGNSGVYQNKTILAPGDVLKVNAGVHNSAGVARVGFTNYKDRVYPNPTSGVWWEFDSAADATHWRYCYASNANASATCASSTATFSAETFYHMEIRIISSSAVTFTIYQDGNSPEVHALTGITVDLGNTNALSPMMMSYANSAATISLTMDYWQWTGTITTSNGR